MTTQPKPDIYGGSIPPRSDAKAFTAYAAAVMAAVKYGQRGEENLQVKLEKTDYWITQYAPLWDWNNNTYRITPATRPKKQIPWRNMEDVPKGTVWLRPKGHKTICLIGYISEDKVRALGAGDIDYEEFAIYEWSHDRSEWSWRKCEIEVEDEG